jgi:glycosyltransferase involved in cell wall biosynthesis
VLRNKIYYRLKPFIPLPVRMALRQKFAGRVRARTRDIWPIMPGSENPPKYWPGWPQGKKFAFVLTHDVESAAGLNRCRQLMELEMELGFRSSFNFIPEGSYRVPAKLRADLVQNGFEVGVHDFRHDGHLFASRREFLRLSSHINHYISEWGATGFRSGFMLHNLDWLHNLDIKYDASTFDIDPFEPQPEGRHTIFPFWIPAPGPKEEAGTNGKQGYVELPYTLPQDSTLFLLLRDETIETWRRKLDWIAEHGGMALVNVHPDYLHFGNKGPSSRTYPATNYLELLTYVRERYENQFWQALPKDVASFITNLETRPVFQKPKRVCMVTHSFYESDNRVTRYAEALAARGDHVDVLSLRRSPDLPKEEVIQGVNVYRIRDRFSKTERSKLAYLLPLLRFLGGSEAWINRSHSRQKYDVLHIHNVPDFLVFSAWYPKLTGACVILDIHDIVPEFFASKFEEATGGLTFKLLCWMERISAAFADHVIIANHLWLEKYVARTKVKACTAFINNVDMGVFTARSRQKRNGNPVILFPGGLQWHQGVDVALRAFKQVRTELPSAEFHIYGDGNAKESLISLADELGLNGSVRFFDTLNVREIAAVMAEADLGVVPKRADSFGNEAYSTKIMEFMAVGVPVVVSSTKVDRHYFDESVVRFFESGDPDSLARNMVELLNNPKLQREMGARAAQYAERNSWENRKADYLEIVDSVCRGRK